MVREDNQIKVLLHLKKDRLSLIVNQSGNFILYQSHKLQDLKTIITTTIITIHFLIQRKDLEIVLLGKYTDQWSITQIIKVNPSTKISLI